MSQLNNEIIELLKDPETIKVLTTLDGNGAPHTVFKDSLTVLEDGLIAYAEVLDTSQTNKNMVRGIWFDKKVTVTIGNKNGTSYQIKGKPIRCVVDGAIHKRFLNEEKEKRGKEADIQAVWLIAPEEVRNESLQVRIREEEEERPWLNKRVDSFV